MDVYINYKRLIAQGTHNEIKNEYINVNENVHCGTNNLCSYFIDLSKAFNIDQFISDIQIKVS